MDFVSAWRFLNGHPAFADALGIGHFHESLYIMVVQVNPRTNCIDEDPALNTETRVWLECGFMKPEEYADDPVLLEHMPDGMVAHDIDLDVGAPTFEEAIIKLANKVYEKYGNFKEEDRAL